MRVAVCVKHAVDETELRMGPDGSPLLAGAAAKISTFDKNAVEEALRVKGSGGGEVVAFSVGPADAKKSLKEALAMGADKGVLVVCDPAGLDSLGTSRLLAAAIARSGPFDAVLCSEGSSDVYTGLVPPMLGEVMGLPYVGYVRKLEVTDGGARAERSLEDSIESVEVSSPFVASVVSEINEPRYPTLIQIMQASKKPVEELTPGQLAPGAQTSRVSVASMTAAQSRRNLSLVEGTPDEAAAKLVGLLSKAGVLRA